MTDEREPRVLYLTDDLGGGTGNHVMQILECEDLQGWGPEIVSESPPATRVQAPVPVTCLPREPVKVYPLTQVQRFLRIYRVVRRRRPQIVHTYFFWPIFYGRLLKLAGVIPRLVENREDTGFGWGRVVYAWLRLTREVPDTVICVSDAVRQVAIEREGLARNRTKVIRNGVPPAPPVDDERVASLRRRYGVPEGAPVVGMVANLNRAVKGGQLFVRLAARVLGVLPECCFLLVGMEDVRGSLKDEARRFGVEAAIRFTGYTDDVASHYELMDVFVLTSQTEGLSICLLEAMSHSLPIVATRVGGNAEVVEHGRTGWLAPVHDVDGLAERVTILLRDPDLRRKIGEAGRRRVTEEFDIGSVAARYAETYRDLVDRGFGAERDGCSLATASAGERDRRS